MTHARVKLSIAGLVVAAGLGYLAFALFNSGVSYMQVDEFQADPAVHSHRAQLRGRVGQEDLVIDAGQMTANFSLRGAKSRLPVVYHGVIPDLFKAGAEVMVEGRLDQAGVFQADKLMTKCPSKYESAKEGDASPEESQPRAAGPHSSTAPATEVRP